MILAVEDELSQVVGEKLLSEQGLTVTQLLGKCGNGYLESRVDNFCQIARHLPVVIITDLDRLPCPVALLERWLGNHRPPRDLMLRVAVREIEAWLLADRESFAELLDIPVARIPFAPETLNDPKRELLALAGRASRRIKDELVVKKGTVASQGIGYNRVLCDHVRTVWDPARAAACAPSLARARQRFGELAVRLNVVEAD